MENVKLDNLYSVVKNVSGVKRKFSFLPPHGVELADNQEYTVFGDIRQAIGNGNRRANRRAQLALANAVEKGLLRIVSTPAPLILNETNGLTKTIVVTGGGNTVAAANPSFATSDSENEPVGA